MRAGFSCYDGFTLSWGLNVWDKILACVGAFYSDLRTNLAAVITDLKYTDNWEELKE